MGIGDGEKHVLLLGFESAVIQSLDHPLKEALKICKLHGGMWTGEVTVKIEEQDSNSDAFRDNFTRAPYLRVRHYTEFSVLISSGHYGKG